MNEIVMKQIARIESDFPEKFGIPRQAGIVDELLSRVVFEPEYRNSDALRGLEGFSHIWIIWQFSEAVRDTWSPTVRPPRLGGNTRMGVFATRSPFRPNAIGLSCVKLERIEHTQNGDVLVISGGDMMNGTPVLDIKPYIAYADAKPDAVSGFAPDSGKTLNVSYLPQAEKNAIPGKLAALTGVLENDPRPRYQADPERVYTMDFGGMSVSFSVDGDELTVREIHRL